MLFFLVLGLLIGALTVIFVLQNIVTISVNFLVWQIEGSLALILLLAVLTGVLIYILLSIPELLKTRIEFTAQKKIIKQLEDENAHYKKIATQATATAQAVAESQLI